MPRYRVAVDTGGTFSDFVYLNEDTGAVTIGKIPSTPDDPSRAILQGVEALITQGVHAADVSYFCHGTTVGTNALLEGKGVRTGLLVTEGFRGIYEVAEQARPYGTAIFDVMYDKPTMLVPQSRTGEVKERVDFRGTVLVPLDEAALREALRGLKTQNIEALAVCLLFSFLHPQHEARVRDIVRDEMPGCDVSLSSEILPQIREYYRLSTTVINAYLNPILARYVANLDRRLADAGVVTRQKYIMQSNGGMSTFAAAARTSVTTVLSGPAGGVTAGVAACAMTGIPNIITFDMGGTSCDVALIKDGKPIFSSRGKIEGRDIAVPMMDINTVSAGGGTIAKVDRFGALEVGPQSAGAMPGPACYSAWWRGRDHHRLQSRARLSFRRQFSRRPHDARLRQGRRRDGARRKAAVARCRRGGRRHRPHHRGEDGGGDQGHLHHARPRSARVFPARFRRRRPGARRPHGARSWHGRRHRAALSRRFFRHRSADVRRQARLHPLAHDADRRADA